MTINNKMELTSPEIISDTDISTSMVLTGINSKTYKEKIYNFTINSFYLKTIVDKLKALKGNNKKSRIFANNNYIMVHIRHILKDKKLSNKLIIEILNNKELEIDALEYSYSDDCLSMGSIVKIQVILSIIKINNSSVVVKVIKR